MDLLTIDYICSVAFVLVFLWKRSTETEKGKRCKSKFIKFIGYSSLFLLILLNFGYQFAVASSRISESVANALLASNANVVLAFTGSIAGVEGIDNIFEFRDTGCKSRDCFDCLKK
jgi:hypothetical protein